MILLRGRLNVPSIWSLARQQHVSGLFQCARFYSEVRLRDSSKFVALKDVNDLRATSLPDFISSPNSKLQSLIWHRPMQNVF